MLKDKVAVVTGGAGLIGKAFTDAIASNNGIAVVADVHKEAAAVCDSLKSELSTNNIDFVQLDITDKSSLLNCVDYVHKKYGRIDAVINNAYPRNKNFGRDFFDVEYSDFSENLSSNLGGYFLTSQQFAQYFIKQGHGNIINIASIYGVVAPRFEIYEGTKMTTPIEYAAIKSALVHLTKFMAKYLAGNNIRVNTLSPGGIFDHQHEAFLEAYKGKCSDKGMLDPNDLCGTLVYLLSDLSKFVNGQNIVVDDGFCL